MGIGSILNRMARAVAPGYHFMAYTGDVYGVRTAQNTTIFFIKREPQDEEVMLSGVTVPVADGQRVTLIKAKYDLYKDGQWVRWYNHSTGKEYDFPREIAVVANTVKSPSGPKGVIKDLNTFCRGKTFDVQGVKAVSERTPPTRSPWSK